MTMLSMTAISACVIRASAAVLSAAVAASATAALHPPEEVRKTTAPSCKALAVTSWIVMCALPCAAMPPLARGGQASLWPPP